MGDLRRLCPAAARYIWRVGSLAELDRDQVIRYIAPPSSVT
jgi:hypothetical protein